jgi:hypothetical protein
MKSVTKYSPLTILGFWLAAIDKGQCGSQTNALWGCKFNANGAETACGVATLDNKNNDLIIATVQRSQLIYKISPRIRCNRKDNLRETTT